MPKIGKTAFIVLVLLAIVGLFYLWDKGSNIINPEYITISYIVPLPIGSIKADINPDFLLSLQQKYNEFKSKVPFLEPEVPENGEFLVKYTITAPEKYKNTSVFIDSSNLLQDIQVRDGGGNILSKDENNHFIFQDDLYKFDDTKLVVVGKTGGLGTNSYSGENIKLLIYSNSQFAFESKTQTIKVCKRDVVNGCSDKFKQFSSLIGEIFANNTKKTTEQKEDGNSLTNNEQLPIINLT